MLILHNLHWLTNCLFNDSQQLRDCSHRGLSSIEVFVCVCVWELVWFVVNKLEKHLKLVVKNQ